MRLPSSELGSGSWRSKVALVPYTLISDSYSTKLHGLIAEKETGIGGRFEP